MENQGWVAVVLFDEVVICDTNDKLEEPNFYLASRHVDDSRRDPPIHMPYNQHCITINPIEPIFAVGCSGGINLVNWVTGKIDRCERSPKGEALSPVSVATAQETDTLNIEGRSEAKRSGGPKLRNEMEQF